MYVLVHAPQCECRGQRVTCKSCFGLCIMWIPGIELRLPGLASNAFTCWAICVFCVFVRVFQGKIRETFENMKTEQSHCSRHFFVLTKRSIDSALHLLLCFCFVLLFSTSCIISFSIPCFPFQLLGWIIPQQCLSSFIIFIGEPLVFCPK